MSFFNPYAVMLLNQKLVEINNKLNELGNFDYETMIIGDYRLKNNPLNNTLDIEFLR